MSVLKGDEYGWTTGGIRMFTLIIKTVTTDGTTNWILKGCSGFVFIYLIIFSISLRKTSRIESVVFRECISTMKDHIKWLIFSVPMPATYMVDTLVKSYCKEFKWLRKVQLNTRVLASYVLILVGIDITFTNCVPRNYFCVSTCFPYSGLEQTRLKLNFTQNQSR